jgi:hypothetical protein
VSRSYRKADFNSKKNFKTPRAVQQQKGQPQGRGILHRGARESTTSDIKSYEKTEGKNSGGKC